MSGDPDETPHPVVNGVPVCDLDNPRRREWTPKSARNCSPDDLRPVDDDVQALRGGRLFGGDYQEPLSVGVHREFSSPHCEYPYLSSRLGDVYKYDAEAREGKLSPAERLALHQRHSAPLMEKLHNWLEAQFALKQVEPNSGLGKAITPQHLCTMPPGNFARSSLRSLSARKRRSLQKAEIPLASRTLLIPTQQNLEGFLILNARR
jgi:hypothetical protein